MGLGIFKISFDGCTRSSEMVSSLHQGLCELAVDFLRGRTSPLDGLLFSGCDYVSFFAK